MFVKISIIAAIALLYYSSHISMIVVI